MIWKHCFFFGGGDSEIPTISVCLWCGLSNSGQWRFSSESPTKHVRILVVTVTGRGATPNVCHCFWEETKSKGWSNDLIWWIWWYADSYCLRCWNGGTFPTFLGRTESLPSMNGHSLTSTGIGDSTAVSTKNAPWIIGFMIHHFRVESELLLCLKGIFHVTTYRLGMGGKEAGRRWISPKMKTDGARHPKRPLP